MHVHVDCDIRSAEQKQTFSTSGTWDGSTLSFTSPSNEEHILVVSQTEIRYTKRGDATMQFLFQPNTNTIGAYSVMGQHLEFTIRTTEYYQSEGHLRLAYQLFQADQQIGQTTITIDYHKED